MLGMIASHPEGAALPVASPSPKPGRLYWVDNLRTAVILLVVNMHACVTYTHLGDWYVTEGKDPSLVTTVVFGLWQGHLQAFFMGLLFFLSGIFAYGSILRKGPGAFMRERLVRLGGPALFYMLVIHPFILLVLNPWGTERGSKLAWYGEYLRSGQFVGSSGPLWFALALLIFCAALALAVKLGWASRTPTEGASTPKPATLWALGMGTAIATFFVRVPFPNGTSVLNFQLSNFAQYVVAFILGLQVARAGSLEKIALSRVARKAGGLALWIGPLAVGAIFFLLAHGDPKAMRGGWSLPAFGDDLWEQLAGLGLGLGMLALFARRFNVWEKREKWLSDRAFAVYVLHAPVLIALTMLFRPLPSSPFLMVPLLTVTGWIASFVVADIARRIPLLRSIL
ncbi:acyltransferase [soil metagenome]